MTNATCTAQQNKFKSRFGLILWLGISLLLGACVSLIAPNVKTEAVALKAGQYKLDKSHASLLFKIEHFKLSKYVGRFNDFDASLDFDPNSPELARLEAIIDIASLDINNQKLAADLLSPKWFDGQRYAQAKFSTQSVIPLNENQFELVGTLDWRDIRKPMTLKVNFIGGANNLLSGKYTVGFSAQGSFLRSDYGVKTYLPVVGDKVEIDIDVEFQKQ